MQNTSRYTRWDKRRIPVQKRTIPVWGAASYIGNNDVKDQSESLYKCWNCGSICNEQNPGVNIGDGVGYMVNDVTKHNVLNVGSGNIQYMGSKGTRDVTIVARKASSPMLMIKDCTGKIEPVTHNNYQKVSSGCSFCGSKQYRNA